MGWRSERHSRKDWDTDGAGGSAGTSRGEGKVILMGRSLATGVANTAGGTGRDPEIVAYKNTYTYYDTRD